MFGRTDGVWLAVDEARFAQLVPRFFGDPHTGRRQAAQHVVVIVVMTTFVFPLKWKATKNEGHHHDGKNHFFHRLADRGANWRYHLLGSFDERAGELLTMVQLA
jgi:hypothetical protein